MILTSLSRPQSKVPARHRLRSSLDALEDRFLLTAGDLDTTFGNGGVVLTSFPPLLKHFRGSGGNPSVIAIQSDGKIVVGGYGTSPILLARLNGADGSLDPNFGSNGLVLTTLPGNPTVKGLALQSDGQIVTAGRASGLPGSTDGYFELLTNWPIPHVRDPARAVELTRKAVEKAPNQRGPQNALGMALYRTGDWRAAVEALGKSMELGDGGNSSDWFFLAMAHWQLGDRDQARTWYDRAVEWMDKNQPQNGSLKRYRAEAAALLAVHDLSTDVFARP